MGIALLLFFFSKKLQDHMPDQMVICTDGDGNENFNKTHCLQIGFIARMSFILTIFHAFIFIVTLARNEMAGAFHDGCWGFKSFLVGACFVGSFWIDSSFFTTFANIAKYVSVVFLVYQALLMLVVSYKINGTLVSNYEKDEGKCSAIILMLVTLCVTAGNGFWIVLQYTQFKCAYNITFMTITMLGIIVMYGLVFLRTRADASILTSGIAALYCLYLQWSALSSDPNTECNHLRGSGGNDFFQIGLGIFFTLLSLFIISASTAKKGQGADHLMEEAEEEKKEGELTEEQVQLAHERQAGIAVQPGQKNQDGTGAPAVQHRTRDDGNDSDDGETLHDRRGQGKAKFAISPQTIQFQLLLILSSVYYCMLFTNWMNPELFTSKSDTDKKAMGTFWLKFVCEWITMFIYVFSLVAPLIFRDRDFN